LVAMLLLSFEANAVREIVVTLALPVVAVGLALAVRYGVAEQQMASILFFSTVLSFLTIAAFFGCLHKFNIVANFVGRSQNKDCMRSPLSIYRLGKFGFNTREAS